MAPPLEYEMMTLVPPQLPFDRPSSFSEATEVTRLTETSFTANLRADWAYGPRVNGGYLVSVMLKAAKESLDSKFRNTTEAASWSINFLDAAQVGTAEIKIDHLRQSTTSTFLRVDLWRKGRVCATCSAVLLDLMTTMSHPLELRALTGPELPFEDLRKYPEITETTLKQEGWQSRDMAEFQSFYRTKPYAKYYLPPDSDMWNSRHVIHPTLGPSFRDMWFTFGEGALTPESLPIAIDSFLPLHLNFPEGSKYFITTQSIQCETKKVSASGYTWIFGRAELKECSGGKYVMDATLYDQHGQIVALARLVQVLISLESLTGKRGRKKQENKANDATDGRQHGKSRL